MKLQEEDARFSPPIPLKGFSAVDDEATAKKAQREVRKG